MSRKVYKYHMVHMGMKILQRFKRIRESYVRCNLCGKEITGRTIEHCSHNFKQHLKKCKGRNK